MAIVGARQRSEIEWKYCLIAEMPSTMFSLAEQQAKLFAKAVKCVEGFQAVRVSGCPPAGSPHTHQVVKHCVIHIL